MRSWGREDGGDLGVRKERIQFRINGSIFSLHHVAGMLVEAAGLAGGDARVCGEERTTLRKKNRGRRQVDGDSAVGETERIGILV